MPLVRISVPAHLAAEKVHALADAVHEALVATCDIPPNERFQLISRFATADMFVDATFPNVTRSAEASIIEITLLKGRCDEKKRSLFRMIIAGTTRGGFRPDDVMVALIENAAIDWSLGRGEAYESVSASLSLA